MRLDSKQPWSVSLLLACLLVFPLASAEAQMGKKGKGGGMMKGSAGGKSGLKGQKKDEKSSTARPSIQASGMVPQFEAGVRCPRIASPFGSRTRYDGSSRPFDRYGGLHGGLDISLAEGTPLLAIAGGKVVHSGTGGQAEGFFVWLQHAPDDTGLPFFVYSKYQHLRERARVAVGATVAAGQVIALSGRTGTTGGHFGAAGYPHLHLTTIASPSAQFETQGSRVVAASARFFDPVAIYAPGWSAPSDIANAASKRGAVRVAHAAPDGALSPPNARLVWPVACRPQ